MRPLPPAVHVVQDELGHLRCLATASLTSDEEDLIRVSSFEIERLRTDPESNPRTYFEAYGSLTTRRGQHLLKKRTLRDTTCI